MLYKTIYHLTLEKISFFKQLTLLKGKGISRGIKKITKARVNGFEVRFNVVSLLFKVRVGHSSWCFDQFPELQCGFFLI